MHSKKQAPVKYYVGIDVGSASVRAALVDEFGTVVAHADQPIQIWEPQPDHYEQSSAGIWAACCSVTKKVVCGVDTSQIRGVGFDATCSLVVVDKQFQPLAVNCEGQNYRNVIMWMDHRAVSQVERINATQHKVLNYVGGVMSVEMQPPKLLWIKENLKESCWEKAGYFFDLPDFLSWKATGVTARSLCTVVCKWTYTSDGGWDDSFWEMIVLEDLVKDKYEKIGNHVLSPGESVGNGLTPEAAKDLGLPAGIAVAASLIDAHAGGLGVIGADVKGHNLPCENQPITSRVAMICGTSSCHMGVSETPIFVPGVWGPYFSAMVPGLWLNEGGQSATGKLIDHVVRGHVAFPELQSKAAASAHSIYTYLNSHLDLIKKSLPVGFLTVDLHVWPDFHGNRSPLTDLTLKGMVVGLTLSRGLDELALIYLATIQAIALGTRHILEAMEAAGHRINTLFLCGGLSKNPLFVQMHADITGKPVVLSKEVESVLVGAAILGACASGDFASIQICCIKQFPKYEIAANGKMKQIWDFKLVEYSCKRPWRKWGKLGESCSLTMSIKALSLAGAALLSPGSCAFEDSACGYEWDYAHLPWALHGEGHYISVDTSYEGEKAVLSSPELYSEEWSCVRLIYQIATTSEASPDPARLNLYLRHEGESFDRLLWSAKEPSDSWLIASLDLMNSTKKYKIVLEGEMGQDKSASIAVFEIKITPGYCIECDFEENHLCGFVNRWNPNVNWFVGGGNIRNSQSILPKDHTLNSELGHYMYVDSVYVKHFQEVAQLISPKTMAPMSGCLSFYYQLKQESSIVFTVYLRDTSGFYEEIWKTDSALSADWALAEVDFDAPYPMEVIFEVAFNSAKGGYVALDDISFSPVYCSNQTGTPFNPAEAGCNFEEDLCNFYQDHKDGPGWSRVKVKRNVYRAGDHTTGFGYYLLANTKFTSQPEYIGRLYGPTLPGNLQFCLRFYYALYGFFKMSGTLAVYIFEENHVVQEKIWSVLDSPKGVWTQAEISFKKPMPCKVVFVSWCKSFWDCGLVALDDVSLSLGSCQAAELLLPNPGECTFEKDECMFTQKKRGRGSWHRRRGPTPTSYTGPKGDHTTGVGYYMYIEASNMVYGQRAYLVSRSLRGTSGKQCLTFFYHMYGGGTGLLSVYLKKEGDEEEIPLWRRTGEQSISWLRGLIEYESDRNYQIIFEAIRGVSMRSDTAIDDILFQAGPCLEVEEIQFSSGYPDSLNEIEY